MTRMDVLTGGRWAYGTRSGAGGPGTRSCTGSWVSVCAGECLLDVPSLRWPVCELVHPAAVYNVQDTGSYPNIHVCGTPIPRFGPDLGLFVTLTSATHLLSVPSSCPASPSAGIMHSRCSKCPQLPPPPRCSRLALCPSTHDSLASHLPWLSISATALDLRPLGTCMCWAQSRG